MTIATSSMFDYCLTSYCRLGHLLKWLTFETVGAALCALFTDRQNVSRTLNR